MITAMGDKSLAKETMKKAGVPVVPGSDGVVKDVEDAKRIADEIGMPVIIKASAGGGGRGMRIVRAENEVETSFQTARHEAESAFGNPDVYMEKYLEEPRHVEIQVLGDSYGNVIHLGERDCSVQRRHQKLIEESPSPAVNAELREKMGAAAVKGAKSVKYLGAGTIEFLLDKTGEFLFHGDEHPDPGGTSGDGICDGYRSRESTNRNCSGKEAERKKVKFQGHAIECRINAEDPEHDFRPSPGKITSLHFGGGPGIRIDSHIYAGYQIPPYYDSLVGKLIVHANTRDEAITKMENALEECIIEGIHTTIPFQQEVMRNEKFRSGIFDTKFIDTFNIDD